MEKNQHVVPHKGGWAVRGAGNGKLMSDADAIHDRYRSRNLPLPGAALIVHVAMERSENRSVATGDGKGRSKFWCDEGIKNIR